MPDVVVIGGGQGGLAAAYHLGRTGLTDFVVLDDADGPGGAWRHRWESLTLGRAHDFHELPGLAMEADPAEPANVAVPRYYDAYERELHLPVRRPVKVRAVRRATPEESDGADRLAVDTDQGTWLTRGVINATGTWQRPFWPAYPGQSTFQGRQLHAHGYRNAEEFADQHVVVVGGGASAVQILLELQHRASTTWVTRRAPVWGPPEIDDESRREAAARIEERTSAGLPPQSVVAATGLPLTQEYRRAMDAGVLYRLPMFSRIEPDGVVWDPSVVPPAPEFLSADVLLWATGYRASLDHLAPLKLRTRDGGFVMDGPEVVSDPRIQLVGYGPSATTVGATRAARVAVRNLRRVLGF